MNKCSQVALILPAKDEASRFGGEPYENCLKTYGDFFREEFGSLFYGLVIDDGSTDDTAQLAEKYGWMVVSHPHNLGKGAAIRTGVSAIISRESYDPRPIIAFADSDGQYSPDTVYRLIAKVKQGADIAVAKRAESSNNTSWRAPAHLAASWLIAHLAYTGVSDAQAGAMAFNGDAADIWVNKTAINGYAATAEFLHNAYLAGLRADEVPTQIKEIGGSHVTVHDALRFALDIVKVSRAS